MSVIYRTYMEEIPEKFRGLIGACFVRPVGGLWGCRGDEWKEYVLSDKRKEIEPDYPLERLNHCFEWKLKKGTKVFTINSEKDFVYLVENYFKKFRNKDLCEINYKKFSKDYDAIEVTQRALDLMGNGCNFYGGYTYQWQLKMAYLYRVGLMRWDVPSICVLNTDKVRIIKEIK